MHRLPVGRSLGGEARRLPSLRRPEQAAGRGPHHGRRSSRRTLRRRQFSARRRFRQRQAHHRLPSRHRHRAQRSHSRPPARLSHASQFLRCLEPPAVRTIYPRTDLLRRQQHRRDSVSGRPPYARHEIPASRYEPRHWRNLLPLRPGLLGLDSRRFRFERSG